MPSLADQRHAEALQLARERKRLTELFIYFRSTSRAVHRNLVDIDSAERYQPAAARLSADPALNAFSQLGCLRLKCDRAFISLIDDKNQHIVAEATQSISLYDDRQCGPGDELALGEMPLDLLSGVCAGTIKVFTSQDGRYNVSTSNIFADQTRYVINDFTLDETYSDRPYVKGFPYMRYYAEVPLITPGGYVIGSFCVVDNKPRQGLSDEGYRILEEIASTIMRHLGLVKSDYEQMRAGLLLDGLNRFVQGEPTTLALSESRDAVAIEDVVDRTDEGLPQGDLSWPPPESNNTFSSNSGSAAGTEDLDHRNPSIITSPYSSIGRSDDVADSTGANSNCDSRSQESANLSPTATEKPQTPLDEVSMEDQIATTFQRASCILRQAMDLEGVVFLGALPSTSGADLRYRMANKLGYSIQESSDPAEDTASPNRFSLPESLHQSLLARHPRGQVFAFDAERFILASTRLHDPKDASDGAEQVLKTAGLRSESKAPVRREIDSVIQTYFPAASSMVFMPLWNPHKNQWFAGCIGWTNDVKRVLSSKEFGYFSAFGNSIMAEVSRLELLATDIAKSDFISSMSHELRSPLHGVLGSAELLRSTNPNEDQRQMIEMVEICGRTLLDTMEHILDYSKINNLKDGNFASQKATSALHREDSDASDARRWSDFDLSMLVEDTVEGTMAGHRFNASSFSRTGMGLSHWNDGSSEGKENLDLSSDLTQRPDVILNIENCSNWTIKSDVGAWRRILLNLFGNSLKYTASGFIEVALRSETGAIPDQGGSNVISLVVRDTGRGISQEYLQNHLYKPFMQEDAFSVGAGLGLSIVHKLVRGLGGWISIDSGLGLGTQVTVTVPVAITRGESSVNERLLHWPDRRTLCLLTIEKRPQPESTPLRSLSATSKSAIAFMNALTNQANQWFNLDAYHMQEITSINADIVVLHESSVHLLEGNDGKNVSIPQIPADIPVIIICSSVSNELHLKTDGTRRIQCLTQPVGPRKLAKVLAACFGEPERESGISMGGLARPQESIDRISQAKRNQEPKPTTSSDPGLVLDGSEIHSDFRAAHESNLPERLRGLGNRFLQDVSTSTGLPSGRAGRRPHLLMVDDNEINLKILVVYLKKLKCTFAIAKNGQQALDKYRQSEEAFDFVLMDISMPIMDGFESTRHIRAFEQEKNMIPSTIIALTGLGSAEAQREASRSGVDLFLPKPVPMQKLKSIVERTFRWHDGT